ncbi:MAG: acyl-ACP--UDP-N-acetylglucosamine O-acyltransferase [Bacteriovoracia bacterium]
MIHPTAIIAQGAELHASVEVGPYCVIGPNVKIAKGTKLMSHVVVEGWTTIGEDNVIYPFSVLGAIPQDLKYQGERTTLIIGNKNMIREAVTLNLGTVQGGGKTQVGDGNLLMAYVHLGHDCIVGNHCIIANNTGLAGHVILEDYVNVGGMTGVKQFVRLGAHSYIGGQSGVEKDVPPFCIVLGQRPCSIKGANIVGLRRRGLKADTITKINESLKLWVRPDVPKEQCLLEIESQYGELAEIQQFLSFIKSSESGVVR